MSQSSTIMVTGAAGFIGSCMVGYLNSTGYNNIVIVDEFTEAEKDPNYANKKFIAKIERKDLFKWLEDDRVNINFIFHLGARTDTTEFDYAVHEKLNLEYSRQVWNYCAQKNIPLIYASSAATYGDGESGYNDDHDIIEKLKPLNPYGVSKNEFDKWALRQLPDNQPPCWAGLKFFNVYGPNEYHKGRMASVVLHAYSQIEKTGKVKLFRSHNAAYKDGEQLRDFIYVEDVLKIMYWMMQAMFRRGSNGQWAKSRNGIYNVGTGRARTFKDLVTAIFTTMNIRPNIEYIDTPEDIRDKYQYFTEARIDKLRKAGYTDDFFSLEQGVATYASNFLIPHNYY
ncbi:MAG TPA: ADP-glyceromanno-heptose 6-epimerase [Chitinophagaceae bacterium]|nr:ADP-glyceromanno-heptose 6-epimerase [Chitinophagaceae bacterium]